MTCQTMRCLRAAYYALSPRERVGVTIAQLLRTE